MRAKDTIIPYENFRSSNFPRSRHSTFDPISRRYFDVAVQGHVVIPQIALPTLCILKKLAIVLHANTCARLLRFA